MFATGETMGLAEWIIDDTCLVDNYFFMAANKVIINSKEMIFEYDKY